MSRRVIDWMFLSRRTGRIVVVQSPNLPLVVWFVCAMAGRLTSGRTVDLLAVVAAVSLAVWAIWEIVGGVNPFRRLLGVAVLGWMIYTRLAVG